MAKDPVCPIYYNDLLGATRDWTDEEFGCYVRLLLEQWDKGYIPSPYQKSTKNAPNNYQRLTRISTSIEQNWSVVGKKFIEADNGLININMEEIRNKRLKFRQKQRENRESGYKKNNQNSTKHSTRTEPPIENEYIISIISIIEEDKGYTIKDDEKKTFMYLVVEMAKMFKQKNPSYFFNKELDYSACLKIAYNIATLKEWKKYDVVSSRLDETLKSWGKIIEYVKSDKWLSTRTLTDLSDTNEWQRLVQKMTSKSTEIKKQIASDAPPLQKLG